MVWELGWKDWNAKFVRRFSEIQRKTGPLYKSTDAGMVKEWARSKRYPSFRQSANLKICFRFRIPPCKPAQAR